VRLLMPPGHQFTHSSGVYTKKGSVLPWEEGGERRQECYSETSPSEAHYSGGYLYYEEQIQPEKHFMGPSMEISMLLTKKTAGVYVRKKKIAFPLPEKQYK